jgi:hypothetical protein
LRRSEVVPCDVLDLDVGLADALENDLLLPGGADRLDSWTQACGVWTE